MIYLIDGHYNSGITEASFNDLLNGNTIKPKAFIFRGRGLNNSGALKDDAEYGNHKKLCNDHGFPWGAYMVPVYPSALQGVHDFWAQAADYWNLINSGGKSYTVPAIFDAEAIPGAPLPASSWYSSQLQAACEFVQGKAGYWPILYGNYDFFHNYLQVHSAGKWFVERCPLWIASPRQNAPWMPEGGWTRWALWQFALDVKDFRGSKDIDLDRWPGTYAEFLAWCKNPTVGGVPAYDPIEDGAVPPVDPGNPPPPADGDVKASLARIEANQAAMATVMLDVQKKITHVDGVYK